MSKTANRPLTSLEMVNETRNLCRYVEDRCFKGDALDKLVPIFERIDFLLDHLQQAENQRVKDGLSIRSFAV